MIESPDRHFRLSLAPALLIVLVLGALPAWGTATGDFIGNGTISIVRFEDAAGGTIPPPPTLTIAPFATGPTGAPVTQSGPHTLTFGGSQTITGTGQATTVALVSQTSASADPGGAADGFETVAGSIQFINTGAQSITLFIQFDYGQSASATVTDPVGETASGFSDVEYSLTGESADCNLALAVDDQINAAAPPDDVQTPAPGSRIDRVVLADGESCTFNSLIQTTAQADSPAIVPTAPRWAFLALALALLIAGAARLGREREAGV